MTYPHAYLATTVYETTTNTDMEGWLFVATRVSFSWKYG